MRHATTRRAAALVALIALTAGCGAANGPSSERTPTPYDGEPATIELWSSTPALENAARLWNAKGGPVTIDFVQQAGPDSLNRNLRNAVEAGSGPCVVDSQQPYLPTLAIDGMLMNITDVAAAWKDDYDPAAWSAVQTGNRTYGVPYMTDPTFMLYNEKIFADAGLALPRTWAEYIAAGRVLNQRGIKIVNFAGEDPSAFVAIVVQQGARWWRMTDEGWIVDIDNEETRRAAEIVQQMIDGDMNTTISYSEFAAMMQQYDDGRIASRQLSTWQTRSMQSQLTEQGLGRWTAAPNLLLPGVPETNTALPRTLAVTSTCDEGGAAADFVHWATTDPEVLGVLADPKTGQSWLPAVAESAPYIQATTPRELLGDNAGTWAPVVANAIDTAASDWSYGPNQQAATSKLGDLWGKVLAKQMKAVDIAPQLQQAVVDDLRRSGYTVITPGA